MTVTGCAIGFFGEAAGGALTKRLAEAVAAHDGCRAVPLREAEIVVVIAPELDQLDALAAIEQIAGRPDAGLPDYAAVIGPRCRAVWLLTVGAEQVDRDEPTVAPAQAALAAMHRSVGFEFPDQTFGHIDLPSRDVDAPTALAVVEALLGDGAETPRRYVRTFRECRESTTSRPLDATGWTTW